MLTFLVSFSLDYNSSKLNFSLILSFSKVPAVFANYGFKKGVMGVNVLCIVKKLLILLRRYDTIIIIIFCLLSVGAMLNATSPKFSLFWLKNIRKSNYQLPILKIRATRTDFYSCKRKKNLTVLRFQTGLSSVRLSCKQPLKLQIKPVLVSTCTIVSS